MTEPAEPAVVAEVRSAVVAEHLAEHLVEAGADVEVPHRLRAVGALVDVADGVLRWRLARDRLLPHRGEAAARHRHDMLLGAVGEVDRHHLDTLRRRHDPELALEVVARDADRLARIALAARRRDEADVDA